MCRRNFLSPATMNMLHGMRGQLIRELQQQGLIQSLAQASTSMSDLGTSRCLIDTESPPSPTPVPRPSIAVTRALRPMFAGVTQAVLLCGLYPLVSRLAPVQKGNERSQKAIVITRKGEKARIHQSSVNGRLKVGL